MTKQVNADEASEPVKTFLRQLNVEEDNYIVELDGEPLLGIVPPWQVEQLQRDKEEVLKLLQKSWARTRDVPEEVIEQEVSEAVRRVRARRREPA